VIFLVPKFILVACLYIFLHLYQLYVVSRLITILLLCFSLSSYCSLASGNCYDVWWCIFVNPFSGIEYTWSMNYLLNLLSLEFLYNISLLVAFGAEKLTILFGLQVMDKKGPSSPPLFLRPLLPYSGDYVRLICCCRCQLCEIHLRKIFLLSTCVCWYTSENKFFYWALVHADDNSFHSA